MCAPALDEKKISYNFNVDLDFSDREPGDENKHGHAERKPEVLLADDMRPVRVPLASIRVIDVA